MPQGNLLLTARFYSCRRPDSDDNVNKPKSFDSPRKDGLPSKIGSVAIKVSVNRRVNITQEVRI